MSTRDTAGRRTESTPPIVPPPPPPPRGTAPGHTELAAAGLDQEQEIRARALAIAASSEARFGWELLEIAGWYAAWIRTGVRPDQTGRVVGATTTRKDTER